MLLLFILLITLFILLITLFMIHLYIFILTIDILLNYNLTDLFEIYKAATFTLNHTLQGSEDTGLGKLLGAINKMEGPQETGDERPWKNIQPSDLNGITSEIQKAEDEVAAIDKRYQRILNIRDEAQDADLSGTANPLYDEMVDEFDRLEEAKEKVKNLKNERDRILKGK